MSGEEHRAVVRCDRCNTSFPLDLAFLGQVARFLRRLLELHCPHCNAGTASLHFVDPEKTP